MTARLTFDNVTFEQGSEMTVDVQKGEQFDLALLEAPNEPLLFATTRDKVLQVDETTVSSVEVRALSAGYSEIQVQGADRTVRFWINIHVYDPAEAVNASIATGETTPK